MKFDNEIDQIAREVIDKVAPDLVFKDVEDCNLGLDPNPDGTGVIITDVKGRNSHQDKLKNDIAAAYFSKQVWPLIEHCQSNGVPVLVMSRKNDSARASYARELLNAGVSLTFNSPTDEKIREFRQAVKDATEQQLDDKDSEVNTMEDFMGLPSKCPTLLSKRLLMETLIKWIREVDPGFYYRNILFETNQIVQTIMAHDFKTLVAVIDMGHLEQAGVQLVERHGFQTLPQQASKKL